jgi:IS30 family transposase
MTSQSDEHLNQEEADRAIERIKSLTEEGCSHREICSVLGREGFKTIKGREWSVNNLRVCMHRLRYRRRTWYALSQRRAGLVVKAVGTDN